MTPVRRYRASQLHPGDIVTLDGHAVLVETVLLVGARLWVIDGDCCIWTCGEDDVVDVWEDDDE